MKLTIALVSALFLTTLGSFAQLRSLNSVQTSQQLATGFEAGLGLALSSEISDNLLTGNWETGGYKIGGVLQISISKVYKINANIKLGLEEKSGSFYKLYYPDSNYKFSIRYVYCNPELVYKRLLLGMNIAVPFYSNLLSKMYKAEYVNIHNSVTLLEPHIGSVLWDIVDNDQVNTKLNFNIGFPIDFVMKNVQNSGFNINSKLINAHLSLSVLFNLMPNNVEPIIKKNYSKNKFQ